MGRGIKIVAGVTWCSHVTFMVQERDQSRGPFWRFRGLLLLTRWLCVSCSVLKGHFFWVSFFLFFLCAGLSSHSSHVTQWPVCCFCLSSRLQLFLSFLLLFLVMFFFYKKKKRKKGEEKKNTGKGITICQPAGILYIIYQKKKEQTWKLYYIKTDGNNLQIL